MSKASTAIKLMNEVQGAPILSADAVEIGQHVVYAPGTKLAGVVGTVVNKQKNGNLDILVGNSTRVDIPVADLLLIDDSTAAVGDPARAGKGPVG